MANSNSMGKIIDIDENKQKIHVILVLYYHKDAKKTS